MLATLACTANEQPNAAETTTAATKAAPPTIGLVDSAQPLAVAGANGWNYQQSTTADLDGDGKSERVVLTARVEMMRGRPVWDDGQPWQLYVETDDKKRTYMYARYVQLGTLQLRLSDVDSARTRKIVILEHLPDRLAIYEGAYKGPDQLTTTTAYEQILDPVGDLASPSLP
jgi:hypothetical protein